MVIKKYNQLELAQKIYSNRDWCPVHAHQFWWVWLLQFRRYCYPQKQTNFPFRPWAIQKIHASRDLCQVHAYQCWRADLTSSLIMTRDIEQMYFSYLSVQGILYETAPVMWIFLLIKLKESYLDQRYCILLIIRLLLCYTKTNVQHNLQLLVFILGVYSKVWLVIS